jgi:hypothetical protein
MEPLSEVSRNTFRTAGLISAVALLVACGGGSSPGQATLSKTAPSITQISPNSGPQQGEIVVVISGKHFANGVTVTFGGVAASAVTVSSSEEVRAVTPAHDAGTVDVGVRNPDGQAVTLSRAFTYKASPSIRAISPEAGPAAGGTLVTITGTNFQSGAAVAFGDVSATAVTVTSTSEIQARSPAHAVGKVDLRVTNPDNETATLAGAFAYLGTPPAVAGVSPSSGLASGGAPVTIVGSGFQSEATVSFGGQAASQVTVVSSTEIRALTPAHAVGTVDVTVQNPDTQKATLAAGFRYGQVFFRDGFESGDFSAWGAITDPALSINSVLSFVRKGNYSARMHYYICGDSTNPACKNEHQDDNHGVAILKNDGLAHSFLRGYVYLKRPEPGGTLDGVGRKLFYLWADPYSAGFLWSVILGVRGASGKLNMYWSLQNGPLGGNSFVLDCGTNPPLTGIACNMQYDTWYAIEMEIQNNTAPASPWNGEVRIWVNGTKVFEALGASLNRQYDYPLKLFIIGQQADRINWDPVDEYRFWDDIVLADAYIGP